MYLFCSCRNRDENYSVDFQTMKRNMDRVKNETYPKRPNSLEELKEIFQNPQILNKYGLNLDVTENLYIETVVTDDYGFCLFASHATINMVKLNITAQHRNYLIDGTFSCSPKMFYQLLIICVEFKNDVS